MNRNIRKFFSPKDRSAEIAPDEIFLDSSNLPQFDNSQFEGRIEKPISRRTIIFLGLVFFLVGFIFSAKAWSLQVTEGEKYTERSENNMLRNSLIFAKRGSIVDRNDVPLAWNEPIEGNNDYLARRYIEGGGFGHLLGYVKYPKRDSSGVYYNTQYSPDGGIEEELDLGLSGANGKKIVEVDAHGKIRSESVIDFPKEGENIKLTVDSRIEKELYTFIKKTAVSEGYSGGAGVIMDVNTGEVLAMTSYPEFDPETMVEGKDFATIEGYSKNTNTPFLNRAVDGLYAPGSIVKPFMAIAALDLDIISPNKQILSTGSISIPNPYDPKIRNVFKDWKAHGWVDMREAIAVSSDVYFYAVGGGFEDQKGMGIAEIDKYSRLFGFGEKVPGDPLFSGKKGTIPNPEWKKLTFDGEAWNIGNTYHTVIGQYGFQVTPIQVVRSVAAIANNGFLLEPKIVATEHEDRKGTKIDLEPAHFKIIQEGMRLGVLEGTSKNLNVPYTKVAGKTGTAEIGAKKLSVNSWAVGYFPYENPKYAYVVIMEKGPVTSSVGGVYVMRQLFDWMGVNTPEYFQ